MRLIILTRYYPLHLHSGGMETHAKNSAEFLAKAGHDVHVVTTRADDGFSGITEANGVQIHLTNSWIKFGVFGDWWWKSLSEIEKIHNEKKVDFVISEGTSGYSYLASSFSKKVPCVYIAHGDVWNEIKSKYYRLPDIKAVLGIFKLIGFYTLESLLLRRVHILVAITRNVEHEFRKLYPFLRDKIRLIPNNGIDTNKFRPLDEAEAYSKFPQLKSEKDTLKAISVGRVTKEKGILVLLKAVEMLKEVPLKLIIVGDGDFFDEAKKYVKENGLNNSVIFLGRIPNENIPLIYSISDVAVFPSIRRAEGQPFVLIESMACGVPSICSDVRGFHEVIEETGVGWLIPAGDFIELANRIRSLTIERTELQQFKDKAVSIARERYDMNKNIEQLEGILIELQDS